MKKSYIAVLAVAGLIAVGIAFYATQLGDDDVITERIVERLDRHPGIDAAGLEVSFDDGTVRITGHVPDEATRKLVIEEVESVDGVARVVEEITIDVAPASEAPTNANKDD